jgi:patatin-like phospholipase/acyl hydrolase
MPKHLILSIDGGGTRGIIPATMLALLEADFGVKPLSVFDIMAGTSTGGIICIGLSQEIPAADMALMYRDKATQIFKDSIWDDIKDGFGKNFGADYTQTHLEKIVKDLVGVVTLGDFAAKHPDRHLMLCAFDLCPEPNPKPNSNDNFQPIVFNSYYDRFAGERLYDIACRISAGPTYFPIREHRYIDGGVGMNHPAMAAVAFALNKQDHMDAQVGQKPGLGWKREDIKVLSLGCGTSNLNRIERHKVGKGDWGNLDWVKYLPDLLTESNMQASEYYVRQVLPKSNYLRIQTDLKDLAVRLNRSKPIELDCVKPKILDGMKDLAEQQYRLHRNEIKQFLGL